jgi:hypothetical protein
VEQTETRRLAPRAAEILKPLQRAVRMYTSKWNSWQASCRGDGEWGFAVPWWWRRTWAAAAAAALAIGGLNN